MTPERWQQIDDAFAAALEQPAADRNAWLRRSYAGDEDLVQRVLSLLDSADESEEALGESVTRFAPRVIEQLSAELASADAELPLGGQIGAYRLLREIGRGGMGTVYLAERADAEFEKRVALKLVRRGMDTDEVLLRFRHERQILASLEHPNIARLYDGGAAADGRPFLVMEYVEGRPIQQYCDEERLTVEDRLRLFQAVCSAVSYAHRNLVVHRDIKPSNIIVSDDGTPRLLDFGIARLLDPAADETVPRTRTGQQILTPEYASPEQRRGEAITTSTDVYSLGLVLFELLSGSRPDVQRMERPSVAAARSASAVHAARQSTPARLQRQLRGDIDTIVMRALAEDPTRRYASAEQLGADIERHLTGLPVLARGDSLSYRTSTFVRRHRGAVAAAALIVLSLITGLAAALWQADRAARQRDEAQLERQRAEEISTFMVNLFEAADPLGADGSDTMRVRTIVDRGAQRVRAELNAQPQLQSRLLTTLGRVYMRLGLYDPAQELLDESLRAANGGTGYVHERTQALAEMAQLAQRRGDADQLDSLVTRIIATYDSAGWAPDLTYLNAISQRAAVLESRGEYDEARALHQLALTRVAEVESTRGVHYARLLNNLAVHHASLEQHAEAEPLLRESIAIERRVLGESHTGVADGLNNLASVVQYQGRHAEAEKLYREAIDIARAGYGADHPYVAQFMENLATLFDDGGRHGDAQPLYAEALRISILSQGERSLRTAMLQRNYALNRHSAGDYITAEALLRAAIATLENEVGADHLYTALAEASLGRTLTYLGRPSDALATLRRGLVTLEQHLPADHWRLHHVASDIGVALAALGRTAAAEKALVESHDALVRLKGTDDYASKQARTNAYRFFTTHGMPDRAAGYAPPSR